MNTKKINIEIQKQLTKDYLSYKYSNFELMNKYNIGSSATLYRYLRKNCDYAINHKKRDYSRKHIFDYKFFNKIDTEEKAYWLGFLYADGSVSPLNRSVSLRLCEKDKDHLEKFKQAINAPSIPISSYIRRNFKIKNYFYDKKTSYNISVHSMEMVRDLCNKGCVPKKSLILKFPTNDYLPEKFVNHFIRGYLDGDGYISTFKNKKWNRINYRLGFYGTNSFLSTVLEIIKKYCGEDINPKVSKEKNQNLHSLVFAGNKKIRRIFDFIYKNNNISLERKYQIYQKFLTLEDKRCGEDDDYRAIKCEFERNDGKILKISNLRKFCRDNPEYYKSRSRLMDLHNGKILSYRGLRKRDATANDN